MTSEVQMQANDQADFLGGIPHDSYSNNPAAAFEIMSHVIAMTKIPLQVDRHRYGQEILRNLGANFYNSYNTPFKARISTLVGTYQELPNFNTYSYRDMSNRHLVKWYRIARKVLMGMISAGYGYPGTKALEKGYGAYSGAKDVVVDNMKQLKLPDSSEILTGAKKGAGPMPKSPVQALVWVVGYAAYSEVSLYKERLSIEIKRRWKNKTLPKELYQEAFGSIMFGIDDMYPSVKELNQFDETDNLKTKQYDNPEPDVAP